MQARTFSTLILAFVAAGFTTLGAAQMNHGNMKGGAMAGAGMQGDATKSDSAAMVSQHGADSSMTEGLVKKVDKTKATVTLAHGAMNGMPPMTMAYKVKDAAWLDQLKAGQKIRFATDPADGGMTVTRFDLVK
jgi:Cu/Ag efflux protein CusF